MALPPSACRGYRDAVQSWVTGFWVGGFAVLLGALAHGFAGGQVNAVPLLLVAGAGALIGGAVLEFGLGRWGLVAAIALLQVAAHVLIEPVAGHRAIGHAHGVAGQVVNADAAVFVDHLTGSATAMVALHSLAFAVVALLLGVATPLLAMLVRVSSVLRTRYLPTRPDLPGLAITATICHSVHSLTHVVVRRGPPAFV